MAPVPPAWPGWSCTNGWVHPYVGTVVMDASVERYAEWVLHPPVLGHPTLPRSRTSWAPHRAAAAGCYAVCLRARGWQVVRMSGSGGMPRGRTRTPGRSRASMTTSRAPVSRPVATKSAGPDPPPATRRARYWKALEPTALQSSWSADGVQESRLVICGVASRASMLGRPVRDVSVRPLVEGVGEVGAS